MHILLYLLLGLCMAFVQTSDVYIDFHQDAQHWIDQAWSLCNNSKSHLICLMTCPLKQFFSILPLNVVWKKPSRVNFVGMKWEDTGVNIFRSFNMDGSSINVWFGYNLRRFDIFENFDKIWFSLSRNIFRVLYH